MLSEDESPVGSSGDDGAFARPPLRHDLVVSIVADDDFNVQRLSAATAAAVRRLGGPPDAAGLHVLGYAHLRWVLVDSALVSNDRSWAREISSLRRSTSLVTHWLDYAVIAGSWFDTVVSVDDFVSDKHERVMDLRVLGTFRMWGPLARCIRQGHIRWAMSVPVNQSTTKRLVGAPCHRPTYRIIAGLLARVPSQPRPISFSSVVAENKTVFMSPCSIVKFIISTRHLRSLQKAKEAHADTIRAAFGDDAELTHQPVNPPSRAFLIRARPRFDVAMMLMRRHSLSQRVRDIRTAPFWYYMADASPASGFESFSIVENMVDGNICEYRIAPCTFLAVGQLSLKHK
jgi:hypothetical protein